MVLFEIDGVAQTLTGETPNLSRNTQPKTVFGPVAPERWPLWAKTFRAMANVEDKGVGDVVARMIGDEKSEAFKAWHLATFGKPCNCTARRERWNRLYPLNQ